MLLLENSGEGTLIRVFRRNDSYQIALLTTRNELLYKSEESSDVSSFLNYSFSTLKIVLLV